MSVRVKPDKTIALQIYFAALYDDPNIEAWVNDILEARDPIAAAIEYAGLTAEEAHEIRRNL